MKDVVKSQTPVIAISAGVLEEEVQECKTAGINGFIPKPFKEEELYTGLSQLLQPSGDKKIKNFEMNHYSNIQKPGNSYYDLTQLRQLSNGDDKFFKEMIQLFIDTTKSSVQAMAQALTEERWIDIANTAHQIAASCRHMGAEQLLQLLKLIENNIREQNNTEDIPDLIRQVKKEAEAMILALAKDNSELSLRIS
jgi:HPt (histidine-containing phosphotransfer) domain-containing protein